MDDFLAIIEAYASVYDSAKRALGYEREVLESLKKNDDPLAYRSVEKQERKVRALEYVCAKLERCASLEGVSREGVRYLENKGAEDRDDNVSPLKGGETGADSPCGTV